MTTAISIDYESNGCTRTLQEKLQEPYVSIRDFGASPDKSAAYNTAAIRDAIDAAAFGTLFIPRGEYLVSNIDASGSILKLDRQIRIIGEGMSRNMSVIKVASMVPSTVDVFRVEPLPNDSTVNSFGWSMSDIRIATEAGAPARHGINVNLAPGAFLAKFLMSRCWVGPFGGKCFYQFKDTSADLDGFFSSVLQDSIFLGQGGAIHLENTGDSLLIAGCTVAGNGLGIYMKPLSGAAMQTIRDCNITSAGGALHAVNAFQMKVLNNQIEQSQAYTGTLDASVTLENCKSCDVIGNNINGHSRVSPLRIKGAGSANNTAEKNVMLCVTTPVAKHHFVIDADAGPRNVVGLNSWYVDGLPVDSPRVSNSASTPQIGVWKPLAALNGWTPAGDIYFPQGAWYRLTEDMILQFRGTLTGGATATNMQILAAVPAGARPKLAMRGTVMTYNGSTWPTGVVVLDSVGRLISQSLPSNVILQLDGLSFQLSDA